MTTNILSHDQVRWTNIVLPDSEDIRQLASNYPRFHPLNLEDCKTELEFPKIDHHDEYLFLVFQFPVLNQNERNYLPAEIDIFIAQGVLVTSHRSQLQPLDDLFNNLQNDVKLRDDILAHGASPLLYHLLTDLIDYCYPIVQKVSHHVNQIEEHLFHEHPRQVLDEIALVRRDVIALRHILRPQLETIKALEVGSWSFIHEELDLYWSDLGDHLSQLCARLDENAEVISGLSETIDTLASHRIDEVVRLLTVVTVLTLPLTLLATIFGMNIIMPYSEHPLLFYGILLVGIILTILTIWYLRNHRWL